MKADAVELEEGGEVSVEPARVAPRDSMAPPPLLDEAEVGRSNQSVPVAARGREPISEFDENGLHLMQLFRCSTRCRTPTARPTLT